VRVAGIEEFGDGVTVLEVPDPRAPRTGEVLIEVKGAGVGNWDESPGLAVAFSQFGSTVSRTAASAATSFSTGYQSVGTALVLRCRAHRREGFAKVPVVTSAVSLDLLRGRERMKLRAIARGLSHETRGSKNVHGDRSDPSGSDSVDRLPCCDDRRDGEE